MKWIITDALPPRALAQSLGQALQTVSVQMPQLLAHVFDRYQARVEASSIRDHACTPAERLLLESLSCPLSSPDSNQPIGSALAALHAAITNERETVWIAQACSTVISSDRATILTLPYLQASEQDLEALQTTACELMGQPSDPIWLEPLDPGRWRVQGDLPSQAWLASPEALQGQDMGDWWPTEAHWRGWRRLLNEIQMCWHEHPVNEQRQEEGKPEINGLWLYGGGAGWTPKEPNDVHWVTDLSQAATHGDWQSWMTKYQDVLQQLDSAIKTGANAPKEIVLTGNDRIVYLEPINQAWLTQLLNRSIFKSRNTPSWSSWWNNV